jgi:hypothetical protein
MELSELIRKLESFKGGGTQQSWIMVSPLPKVYFENEYIKVLRIDTSNPHGGVNVKSAKQWGIIIEIKKEFFLLPNWKKLKEKMKNDIKVTPRRGYPPNQHGIRLYNMSRDPNNEIIEELLTFIFK